MEPFAVGLWDFATDNVILWSDTTFAERHCTEVWVVILRSAVGATKDLLVVNAPEILRALCALRMTFVIVILRSSVAKDLIPRAWAERAR